MPPPPMSASPTGGLGGGGGQTQQSLGGGGVGGAAPGAPASTGRGGAQFYSVGRGGVAATPSPMQVCFFFPVRFFIACVCMFVGVGVSEYKEVVVLFEACFGSVKGAQRSLHCGCDLFMVQLYRVWFCC